MLPEQPEIASPDAAELVESTVELFKAAEAAEPREIMPLALRVPPECDGWRLDHECKGCGWSDSR